MMFFWPRVLIYCSDRDLVPEVLVMEIKARNHDSNRYSLENHRSQDLSNPSFKINI